VVDEGVIDAVQVQKAVKGPAALALEILLWSREDE
jgi:hypothetical protein